MLTGTPLENRLEELYSIVEFVDRHRLGPMFRFLAKHQHVDESGRVIGYHHLGRISRTLEPIMVRRTKKQVLKELPQRLDKRLFVPMTPQQQAIHDENSEIVAKIVAKWRRYHYLSDGDQRRLMIALQYMRMACNSTYLCDRESDHSAKIDEAEATLSDLLEDRDQKVVVFSQWVGPGHDRNGRCPSPATAPRIRGCVGRGRLDERCVWASGQVKWLRRRHPDWPELGGIVCVEGRRQDWATGKTSTQRRYYLTSLDPRQTGAGHLGDLVRGHWSVENNLHWCLDVSFGDDAARVRKDHGPANLAPLNVTCWAWSNAPRHRPARR